MDVEKQRSEKLIYEEWGKLGSVALRKGLSEKQALTGQRKQHMIIE